MQSSAAISIAERAISRAPSSVCFDKARAAAVAYGAPDPMAAMPSSGSITSPSPEISRTDPDLGNQELSFEPPQIPVGSPFLGQLNSGSAHVAVPRLELPIELLDQCQGIGDRSGKSGDHRAVLQGADLARTMLHDDLAKGHLPITRHRHAILALNGDDRCGMGTQG